MTQEKSTQAHPTEYALSLDDVDQVALELRAAHSILELVRYAHEARHFVREALARAPTHGLTFTSQAPDMDAARSISVALHAAGDKIQAAEDLVRGARRIKAAAYTPPQRQE